MTVTATPQQARPSCIKTRRIGAKLTCVMANCLIVLTILLSWSCLSTFAAPGDIITSQVYEQLFPNRNPFYTYDSFITAAGDYSEFGNTGSLDDQKREMAAFFGNVMQETGSLQFITEISPPSDYCDTTSGVPCAPGKRYYGRGPLQLSWNYNYNAAGNGIGLDLLNNPELLETDAVDSYKASLWFWMRNGNPNTCHDAIRDNGFGQTIRIINGGIECDKGTETAQASNRINYYSQICSVLGVDPGSNLGCA